MVSGLSQRSLGLLAAPVKMLVRPFPKLNATLSATIWNFQYRRGQWNYLDSETARQTLSLVEEYAPDAKILDLGCGTSANLPLTPGRYRHYHGVDISVAAIQRARTLGRPDTSFETADILTYETGEKYDAILLREVLYYFPTEKVAGLLLHLANFLEPGGKIFVQVWDAYARSEYTEVVRGCGLQVVEERVRTEGGGGIVIVLASPDLADR
jgi:trans-aconitate methyltransferase